MSRQRNKMREAYASVFGQQQPNHSDSIKDTQKVCGTCKKFSESSWSSDGRGSCDYLKFGTNIHSTPPTFVFEGDIGYLTKTLSSAANCNYYDKMEIIDKDGYECSDPRYRRSMRQFQD